MQVSKKGLDLIKKWEGRHLKAYQDCVGVWTISYGIIDSDYKYTGLHVRKGVTITDEQCDELFEKLIKNKYCPIVDKHIEEHGYLLNQNQYDALVSFAYNIGSISGLTNDGKRSISEISSHIPLYCKAGGKVVQGLVNRRRDEKKLFDTPVSKKGYTGTFPVLPESTFGVQRKYYQIGDGMNQLRTYRSQIKRIQSLLNWAVGSDLKVDGMYGTETEKAVMKLQKKASVPVNGKFGNLCLNYCKGLKK